MWSKEAKGLPPVIHRQQALSVNFNLIFVLTFRGHFKTVLLLYLREMKKHLELLF